MKKSKEYKISMVLFSVCLLLYGISFITGLIPELNYSIDKICFRLGFVLFCLGLIYSKKANGNKDKKED